ncbi:MAG: tetratricopeptide repeat protein [Gelidibacter sp.]
MKYLSIFFFCMFCVNLHSQNTELIDSLKTELKRTHRDDSIKVAILSTLHEKLMFSNPDEALGYAHEELKVSKKIDFKKGIGSGNMHIGNYFSNRNENDSALYYYYLAKKQFKEIHSTRGLIFINHSLSSILAAKGDLRKAIAVTEETLDLIKTHEPEGDLKTKFIGGEHTALANIYIEKGSYKLALIEAFKALKCFNAIHHQSRTADVLKQIGDIESGLENYDNAISYFKQAIEIYNQLGDKIYLAYAYNSLGISYQDLKDYKNARISYNLAKDYATDVGDKLSLSNVLHDLAELEIKDKNYPKAKQLLNEAKTLAEEEDLQISLANVYDGLSQIDFYSHNLTESLHKNDMAIELSKKNGLLPHLQNLYSFRSDILQKLNQHDEAIHYLKASQTIKDSLFSSKKIQQIEELKTLYDIEKKEQEIKNQKNKIALLQVKDKISKQQLMLLGAGLLLALIGLYAFFQKSKRHKLEREKAEVDLEYKTKELTIHALHLAKKNEVLNDLKQKAKVLKADANADPGYQMLIQTINFDLQDDNNWEKFSRYFEEVHKDFNTKARQQFPNITTNDLRLMALLKMNLSSKEIANILNISSDGIKKARQRLRKKMGIDSDESLEAIVISI